MLLNTELLNTEYLSYRFQKGFYADFSIFLNLLKLSDLLYILN